MLLSAAADNTLYEQTSGALSNGSGDYLFIGRTGGGGDQGRRRAVIRFDLGSLDADDRINSVTLLTTISRSPKTSAIPGTARVHRLLMSWGEGSSDAPGPEGAGALSEPGDATWIHRYFDTDLWTQPGGDYHGSASAQALYSTADFEALNFESTAELVADVQAWVSNPALNHGWILLGDEVASANARRLNAREHDQFQPMLMIDVKPHGLRIFDDGFESTIR